MSISFYFSQNYVHLIFQTFVSWHIVCKRRYNKKVDSAYFAVILNFQSFLSDVQNHENSCVAFLMLIELQFPEIANAPNQ